MTGEPHRRILFGVTAHVTAYAFLVGQLRHFADQGWDVHLVVGSKDDRLVEFATREGVTFHVVPASREPRISDVCLLLDLARLMRRLSPDAIVMGTPKMGVFGTLAGALARVSVRVYLMHGLRWQGLVGIKRRVVRALDRVACAAATDVVAVSRSVEAELVRSRLASQGKTSLLGSGSANGVDLARFSVPSSHQRQIIRRDWGIPEHARVVAFIGRLTRDKGLTDLPRLWAEASTRQPDAWLLVVGEEEISDAQDQAAIQQLRGQERTVLLGHLDAVEGAFQAADLHVMLSRREGLGMVALEAAACGVPTVAFEATGVVDAVVDGVTGTIVPRGDISTMASDVCDLLEDDEHRHLLGRQARSRTKQEFDSLDVWGRWSSFVADRVDRYSEARNAE